MQFSRTPIRMEWFYHLEGEKSKLNWFLAEIALEYYDHIMDSADLAWYREQYDDKQIAQYCTYYVRRAKEGLLKCLRGKRKNINLYQEYIEDFYPHHTAEQNRILSDAGDEAWAHMLSQCKVCPQQCLMDYKSRSGNFDQYEN